MFIASMAFRNSALQEEHPKVWTFGVCNSLLLSRESLVGVTPKALANSAQGWSEAQTLGVIAFRLPINPERVWVLSKILNCKRSRKPLQGFTLLYKPNYPRVALRANPGL